MLPGLNGLLSLIEPLSALLLQPRLLDFQPQPRALLVPPHRLIATWCDVVGHHSPLAARAQSSSSRLCVQ